MRTHYNMIDGGKAHGEFILNESKELHDHPQRWIFWIVGDGARSAFTLSVVVGRPRDERCKALFIYAKKPPD